MNTNSGESSNLTTASNAPITNSNVSSLEQLPKPIPVSSFVIRALASMKLLTDVYLKPEHISKGNNLPLYRFIDKCKQTLSKSPMAESSAVYLKELEEILPAEGKLCAIYLKVDICAEKYLEKNENIKFLLESALRCLRTQRHLYGIFLVINLYTRCVLADPDAPREALQKGIEIGRELISDCKSFVKPEQYQDAYNYQLANYLDLLHRYYGDNPKEGLSLPLVYKETLNKLNRAYTDKKWKSPQEKLILNQNMAFLLSRREWFNSLDYLKAVSLLEEAYDFTKDIVQKQQLQLDKISLVLDALGSKDKQEVATLTTMMKTLYELKLNGKLTPYQFVLTSLLQVKIFELLSPLSRENETTILNIKDILKEALDKGVFDLANADIATIQNYLECEILYCYYAWVQPDSKDNTERVCKILENYPKRNFVDSEFKVLAMNLSLVFPKEGPRTYIKDIPYKLFFMVCLRHLLQRKYAKFMTGWLRYCALLEAGNKSIIKFDIKAKFSPSYEGAASDVEKEVVLWSEFYKNFADVLSTGSFERVKDLINPFYIHKYSATIKHLKKYYGGVDHTRFHAINYENIDNEDAYNLSFQPQPRLVEDFISEGVHHPLLEALLVKSEDRLLEGEIKMFAETHEENTCNVNINQIIPNRLIFFSNIFDVLRLEMNRYEGQQAYADMMMRFCREYIDAFYSNSFIEDFFSEDLSHCNKGEKQKIQNLRHRLSILKKACKLAYQFYELNQKWFPHQTIDFVNKTENMALMATNIFMSISKENSERRTCALAALEVLGKQRLYLRFMKQSEELQVNDLWMKTYIGLYLERPDDSDDPLKAEEYYSQLPSSLEEYHRLYPLVLLRDPVFLNKSVAPLLFIKAVHLMSKQNPEVALEVYADFLKIVEQHNYVKLRKGTRLHINQVTLKCNPHFIDLKKLKEDNGIDPEVTPLHKANKMIQEFLNQQESQGSDSPSIGQTENSSQTPPADTSDFAWASSSASQTLSSSEQKEIRENARRLIEQQARKKEEKQKKVKNVDSVSRVPEDISTEVLASSSATTGETVLLNRRTMKIYEKLWEPNSTTPIDEDWANRSFRNDINMTRQECLKLIAGLGGTYSAERGHGSHQIAKLPKIVMNGVDVGGLVDYETGELMITLTNDEVLKHYQIRQLRKILISQGFTPDRVKVKGQE